MTKPIPQKRIGSIGQKKMCGVVVAQMVTNAIDTYVGKERDKQAKVVIQAHTFMQQVRGG